MDASITHPAPSVSWLRFRLRTLFMLMTVVAAAIVFVMRAREGQRPQQKAVAAIHALGSGVRYDYEFERVNWFKDASSMVGKLIRRVLGSEWNVRVVCVNLCPNGGRQPIDKDLEFFQALPDVQLVSFNQCTDITDDGLAKLHCLSKLDSLYIVGGTFNGSGLEYVRQLPLTELSLVGTNITDDSLSFVGSMTKLKRLDLTYTSITDDGIPHLSELKGIKSINLSNTRVTPEGRLKLKQTLPNVEIR